jgi:predicted transcriptional regulator
MTPLRIITFRCRRELFERLEQFAAARNIDRTSALKLAVHFYLNRQGL